MKIAFASTDNIHVNQHFGWCKEFYIYEIVEDKLADLILEDKIGEGSIIDFDVIENEVIVKIN